MEVVSTLFNLVGIGHKKDKFTLSEKIKKDIFNEMLRIDTSILNSKNKTTKIRD